MTELYDRGEERCKMQDAGCKIKDAGGGIGGRIGVYRREAR